MAGDTAEPMQQSRPSGARDGLSAFRAGLAPTRRRLALATIAIALKDIIIDPERSIDLVCLPREEAIAHISKSFLVD
jgi:hypothetical protein